MKTTKTSVIAILALASITALSNTVVAQESTTPSPAAVVTADQLDDQLARSVAGDILNTKLNETPVKGGLIRVGIVHRSAPETRALLHDDLTEIYQILEGTGTLVTGGSMENQRAVSDPPNLGDTPSYFVTQVGGDVQEVGPGDVVILPAGIPHRFSALAGTISYIIYRFEVRPAP